MGASFAYDAWGRMVSKTRGSYSASYIYRYSDMLCGATTDFPGESSVTWDYGANGWRRERTTNGVTTRYRWEGADVINEEDDTGTLTMMLVPDRADVTGTDPGTGSSFYYLSDFISSTRQVRDGNQTLKGSFEYTPFGDSYSGAGPAASIGYGGQFAEPSLGLGYTPGRYYAPGFGRWMTRDPLQGADGPNEYVYVMDNPILLTDPLGFTGRPDFDWPPSKPNGRPNPVPRYGKWCGPNWSAGRWTRYDSKDIFMTPSDWTCPVDDGLDQCCKTHDWAYDQCRLAHKSKKGLKRCTAKADMDLAKCAGDQRPDGLYGKCYKAACMVVFPGKAKMPW